MSVYKLSVQQLHLYFQQPVINDHIVHAQRLADMMDDKTRRDAMYEQVITKLLSRVERSEAKASDTAQGAVDA